MAGGGVVQRYDGDGGSEFVAVVMWKYKLLFFMTKLITVIHMLC